MKFFIFIILLILCKFSFSQMTDNDSIIKSETVVYKGNKVDYKVFYVNGKVIEKIWYNEENKSELKIVHTYYNGVLIKRTWYDKNNNVIGVVLD